MPRLRELNYGITLSHNSGLCFRSDCYSVSHLFDDVFVQLDSYADANLVFYPVEHFDYDIYGYVFELIVVQRLILAICDQHVICDLFRHWDVYDVIDADCYSLRYFSLISTVLFLKE